MFLIFYVLVLFVYTFRLKKSRDGFLKTFSFSFFCSDYIIFACLIIHSDAVIATCLSSFSMNEVNALTLSYSPIWNQNVPQEIPFFIRNQYSVIARKKSKTTAIISIFI